MATGLRLYALCLEGEGYLKTFDPKKPKWTKKFEQAKLFRTIGPARALVSKMVAEVPGARVLRLDIGQAKILEEPERIEAFLQELARKQAAAEKQICGAFSPGDWNDEDNPPVKCTSRKGHAGKHEGGCRGGTLSWK